MMSPGAATTASGSASRHRGVTAGAPDTGGNSVEVVLAAGQHRHSRAPNCANGTAVASPSPLLAPVTIAS
jgi:hypothetical protein